MREIINYNKNSNQQNVTNLKLFSGIKKIKKHKLLRKFLPYLVVTPLFLGVMHYGAGFSIDHGNIMEKNTSKYDGNISSNVIGESILTYRGPWNREEDGYSRLVNHYNSGSFDNKYIHDILVNKDIESIEPYFSSGKIEYVDTIPVEEKLFNDSSMEYVYFRKDKNYFEGNVGFSELFYPVLGYLVTQFGAVVIYDDFLKNRKNKKIVKFSSYKKLSRCK